MTRTRKVQEILRPKKDTVLPIYGDINGDRIESSDPRLPMFYLKDNDDEGSKE